MIFDNGSRERSSGLDGKSGIGWHEMQAMAA
jgi:hypothetical protein